MIEQTKNKHKKLVIKVKIKHEILSSVLKNEIYWGFVFKFLDAETGALLLLSLSMLFFFSFPPLFSFFVEQLSFYLSVLLVDQHVRWCPPPCTQIWPGCSWSLQRKTLSHYNNGAALKSQPPKTRWGSYYPYTVCAQHGTWTWNRAVPKAFAMIACRTVSKLQKLSHFQPYLQQKSLSHVRRWKSCMRCFSFTTDAQAHSWLTLKEFAHELLRHTEVSLLPFPNLSLYLHIYNVYISWIYLYHICWNFSMPPCRLYKISQKKESRKPKVPWKFEDGEAWSRYWNIQEMACGERKI